MKKKDNLKTGNTTLESTQNSTRLSKKENKNLLEQLNAQEIIEARTKSAKEFWEGFKAFAFQGNVIDLAVGVIIGTAFNKIVQSLTSDIIMPIFGRILGNTAFSDLYINLGTESYASLADAVAAGAPVIRYGLFLTNVLDFLIIALSLYIALKVILGKKKQEEEKK